MTTKRPNVIRRLLDWLTKDPNHIFRSILIASSLPWIAVLLALPFHWAFALSMVFTTILVLWVGSFVSLVYVVMFPVKVVQYLRNPPGMEEGYRWALNNMMVRSGRGLVDYEDLREHVCRSWFFILATLAVHAVGIPVWLLAG